MSHSSGDTHLTGWVDDQASLQAAVRRVTAFGLELVSVQALAEP